MPFEPTQSNVLIFTRASAVFLIRSTHIESLKLDYSCEWLHSRDLAFCWETTLYGLDKAAASARAEQMNDYLEERDYLDISLRYAVTDNITVRAGVNNAFAEDAPLSTNVAHGTGNNNTYPGLFDVVDSTLQD